MGVKLTTHLHLMSRLRVMELYLHSPIRLHDVVLNSLSTGETIGYILLVCRTVSSDLCKSVAFAFPYPGTKSKVVPVRGRGGP
jgi:hypothetical protein